jgi:mono/diheme cytochrome c family protein
VPSRLPSLAALLPLFAAAAAAPARGSIDDGSHGAKVYMRSCASCHGVEGAGVPGLQPPLTGDPIIGRSSPKLLMEIILRGPAAVLPAKGQGYGNKMPAFGTLSNRDLATLASFLRRTFGKNSQAVTPAEAAAVRGGS